MRNNYLESIKERTQRKENAQKKLAAYREEKQRNAKLNYAKSLKAAPDTPAYMKPVVHLGEGYEWGVIDYVQSPFALLIGGLHALPDESFGFKCSKNTTSSRNSLLESIDYFTLGEDLEGFTALHDSLSYFDEMDLFCYYAFANDLSEPHWINLFTVWWEIPVNLLYNAGHMWVDAINYIFYTP